MHISSWTAASVQRCRGSCAQSNRHPQCTQGLRGVPTGQNPEDSNLAWSVEAMQWVLLYLSVGHDRCYWEHLAQHGAPSCMYHVRALTASGTASVAVADHVSRCGKTCGPTKQSPKYPCPNITAELLLVSTHYASSYDSHRINVETDIFSSCAPFGYTLYTLMEELWGNWGRVSPPKQLLSWRTFPRRYCFLSLDPTERPCDSLVAQL
jgi:hypothetical protein